MMSIAIFGLFMRFVTPRAKTHELQNILILRKKMSDEKERGSYPYR